MQVKSSGLNKKERNYFKIYFVMNTKYNLVWDMRSWRHVSRYVSGQRKGQIKLTKGMIMLTRGNAEGKLNSLVTRIKSSGWSYHINQKALDGYFGGKLNNDIKESGYMGMYDINLRADDFCIVSHEVDVTMVFDEDSSMFSLF